MSKKILLTSFQTWQPHQVSNASDDLLIVIQEKKFVNHELKFLRQLPVNTIEASQQAIAAINTLAPDVVLCCGMAESRQKLTVESNATYRDHQLNTSINLPALITDLSNTSISHNAGKFVCEELYYQVLRHLKQYYPKSHCLFAHVPVLTPDNMGDIVSDFQQILEKLGSL